jgi:hypothetical protein
MMPPRSAVTGGTPVRYCVETDTMAIEIQPWPGREDYDGIARDAGVDLVIHYAPDGHPWLWEIEHASRHPKHIAAALAALRRQGAVAAWWRQRSTARFARLARPASTSGPTFSEMCRKAARSLSRYQRQ